MDLSCTVYRKGTIYLKKSEGKKRNILKNNVLTNINGEESILLGWVITGGFKNEAKWIFRM